MDPEFTHLAATWQNFYLLIGTAGATLVGLMFVAVTFGASASPIEASDTTRSFIDPTFTHFVQVLVTACLMLVPSMTPALLGGLLLALGLLRMVALIRVYAHMKAAQKRHADLEAS